MDCNSILYDSYHSVSQNQPYELIEKEILEKTSKKIDDYIEQMSPKELIYIAFDGVAPFAKMEQQKTRRYKSWFESSFIVKFDPSEKKEFVSTEFTPGTEFMKKLTNHMKQIFLSKEKKKKYNVKDIILATPDQAGEGEHKLYEHLRRNPTDETKSIAVYGLDADLIMLSLFHLTYCPNIYIVREAPSFAHALIKEENDITNKDEPLFLNVGMLGRCIASEMNCAYPSNHRMYDYVFLCFLLGNDFLPHFPSLNIRTNGVQRLLDIYRNVIGNTQERYLISTTKPFKIQWREVTRFLQELSKHETVFIQQEYSQRKKWDGKTIHQYPTETIEQKRDLLQQLPILFRGKEMFINPQEEGWQERYYHTLFTSNKPTKKQICMNYLEGLEWVFEYYTNGCLDWKWKYNYQYPPLLKDLINYVPYGKMTFFEKKNSKPFRSITQLAYVLPPNMHDKCLPDHVNKLIKKKYEKYFSYETNEDGSPFLEFQWAFCRYFWESHIDFEDIPIEIVDEWNKEF
jgi:5'-3' exonuclease